MRRIEYRIPDCETEGDVTSEIYSIERLGGTVVYEDYGHDSEGEICCCDLTIECPDDRYDAIAEYCGLLTHNRL